MKQEELVAIAEAMGYLRGLSLNEDFVLAQKDPLWELANKLEIIIKIHCQKTTV